MSEVLGAAGAAGRGGAAAADAGRDHAPQSELEAAILRREANPAPVADVFGLMVEKAGVAEGLQSTWQVSRAWFAVNGDIERRVTAGVYVRPAKNPRLDPVLTVSVYGRTRAFDMMANREIYLARLAQAGLHFSEIRFVQSKRPAPKRDDRPAPKRDICPEQMTHLTAEEEARVQEAVAALPPKLRESVSAAMRASLLREKAQKTEKV